MTGDTAETTDHTNRADFEIESKVFVMRGDKKLVRHLAFAKAAGQRPNTLRVSVGSAHGTALTLKNASFARQYRRAIDMIADFHAIAQDDPIRDEMEKTGPAFLEHYGLRTLPFQFQKQGELKAIEDAAFPIDDGDAEKSKPPNGKSKLGAPKALLPHGLVRGVTFRPARGADPALIHVRLWRGKGFSLSLENVSFAKQYAKAIDAVADSLGIAAGDPLRNRLHQTGQAFLEHYALTTVVVTIPDVVVMKNPDKQS